MSDVRFAPVDAPEREAATEPPRRWRNRWWSPAAHMTKCITCNAMHEAPAGEFLSCALHPSKDVADQRALDLIKSYQTRLHYLGAVEEGHW